MFLFFRRLLTFFDIFLTLSTAVFPTPNNVTINPVPKNNVNNAINKNSMSKGIIIIVLTKIKKKTTPPSISSALTH